MPSSELKEAMHEILGLSEIPGLAIHAVKGKQINLYHHVSKADVLANLDTPALAVRKRGHQWLMVIDLRDVGTFAQLVTHALESRP